VRVGDYRAPIRIADPEYRVVESFKGRGRRRRLPVMVFKNDITNSMSGECPCTSGENLGLVSLDVNF
jgi:hypothetical protein